MRKHMKYYAIFVVILISSIFQTVPIRAINIELVMQEVSFKTEDGVTIFGSWIIPQGVDTSKKSSRLPVVILLHDYGMNRRDWGMLIPDLVRKGYGVLAMDLRGHGQSRGEGASSTPSKEELLTVGILDVQAALEWIKSQKTTNSKRAAIVGVGVGADIAYLCSGTFKKNFQVAVAVSPSYAVVTDADLSSGKPKGILFCTSSGSNQGLAMLAAETLSNFTQDPKKVIIYNSAAHGFAIFYKHPEVKQEILGWLGKLKQKK